VAVEGHTTPEEAPLHGNARLTYWARKQIPIRHGGGWTQRAIADQLATSTATVSKWWRRFQADPSGCWWVDVTSRPHRSPNQTPPAREAEILRLRQDHKLGPARIAWRLEMSPSTVHRVLVRAGLNRLAWMDRPTGRVVRRIETTRPGELVNIDIKKLARVPDGGGWRVIGRQAARPGRDWRSRGTSYVHSAIDHYSSIAYSEVLDDERAQTAGSFWRRATGFFAELEITVEAVLTDNGACYRSRIFEAALDGVEHRFIRPYTPRTNGKVERFNRTLLDEWAYVRPYSSEAERVAALDDWLHLYNHHRGHSTRSGQPPITALNNLAGSYT
jgi:transposase InsO family protein